MENMNEIRQHIRAVTQTKKITNAMHLVSSARMKKVMHHVEYNRRYLSHVHSAMNHILASPGEVTHPYLQDRGQKRSTYVVISGDKGLVGSYNADVLHFALRHIRKHKDCHVVAVGITAAQFFKKNGIVPDIEVIGASQDPSLYNARHMTQDLFRLYDSGLTDNVYIIYTQFVSSIKWMPHMEQLLPVPTDEEALKTITSTEMIYHPSPEEMLNLLIPQYTMGILFGALVQSYASEHCARMNAMRSASNNADELLGQLQTQLNMARQSAITQELSEITGAAMALDTTEV